MDFFQIVPKFFRLSSILSLVKTIFSRKFLSARGFQKKGRGKSWSQRILTKLWPQENGLKGISSLILRYTPQRTSTHYAPQSKHSTWQKTSSNPKPHHCFRCYVSLSLREGNVDSKTLNTWKKNNFGFSRVLSVYTFPNWKIIFWLVKKEWWCKSCLRGSYWVESQDTVICPVGCWFGNFIIQYGMICSFWDEKYKKRKQISNRRIKAFLFTYLCKGLDFRQNKSIMKECGKFRASVDGICFSCKLT